MSLLLLLYRVERVAHGAHFRSDDAFGGNEQTDRLAHLRQTGKILVGWAHAALVSGVSCVPMLNVRGLGSWKPVSCSLDGADIAHCLLSDQDGDPGMDCRHIIDGSRVASDDGHYAAAAGEQRKHTQSFVERLLLRRQC
jgi:hypothetical protein